MSKPIILNNLADLKAAMQRKNMDDASLHGVVKLNSKPKRKPSRVAPQFSTVLNRVDIDSKHLLVSIGEHKGEERFIKVPRGACTFIGKAQSEWFDDMFKNMRITLPAALAAHLNLV
jgi:hypothetical protein